MGKLKYTIFTVPNNFAISGVANAQHNAIGSWLKLEPTPEIILCGDDPGVAGVAQDYGLQNIRLERSGYGTPLVSDAFAKVAERAKHDLVVFINTDIVLLQDFVLSLAMVATKFPYNQFLMCGGRWDIEPTEKLNFTCDMWLAQVLRQMARTGVRHDKGGSDYFAGRRGLLSRNMPPFAIGRCGWDNWAISHGVQQGWAVVDATDTTTVIHQGIPATQHHKRSAEDEGTVRLYEQHKGKATGNLSDALWVTTIGGVELRR